MQRADEQGLWSYMIGKDHAASVMELEWNHLQHLQHYREIYQILSRNTTC